MSRPSKKPKYKLDPKKFEEPVEKNIKKEKDLDGDEIFQEMLRSKPHRR